jgi:hypothetical protein
MLKKVLAGLTTLALALGMVALTAGPASAHHSTITATVECTSPNAATITWKVQNWNGGKIGKVDSSTGNIVPAGTLFNSNETKYFTQNITTTGNYSLSVTMSWDNGSGGWNNTETDSGSINVRDSAFEDCEPEHVEVNICHANQGNGWSYIEVDDDSIVKPSGHNSHANDIIPAFTYWAKVAGIWTELNYPGKNLGTNFGGFTGQQILDAQSRWSNDCDMEVRATEPTVGAICTGPGAGTGTYTIPSVPGVQYSVRFNQSGPYSDKNAGTYNIAAGTIVEFKAEGTEDWIDVEGTDYWKKTVPSPGNCIITVAPVEPTIDAITTCGVYGSINYPTTTGVVYTLTSGDGKQGAYTVTATPASGYKFDGPQSVEFKGNLGTYTDCAYPVEPIVKVITKCGEFGSIVMPTTTGVVYTLTVGDGKQGAYTVTATPAPGFSFVGAQSVEYKGDLGTYTECATPLPATFLNGACSESDEGGQLPGTFTIPTKEGVQYSVSFDNGVTYTDYDAGTYDAVNGTTVKVMATALPTYTLEGTTQWSHTFDVKFCPPTEAQYEVFLSSTNQVCSVDGLGTGSITVSVIAGPDDNPVPAVFILNKGTASEQVITGTTQLPPGNYTVTAFPKLEKDSLTSTTGSFEDPNGWQWAVSIAAASTFDCLELSTLALTGTSAAVGGFALAGGLVMLGGIVLLMRRREQQHSA